MKDFVFHGESHPFWELMYSDRKNLITTAGNKEFELTSGHLFIHKPDEFHTVRCDDGAAKQMIREQSYNFTEIADRLSFNTSQYFTTVFRRIAGMTPSEYEDSVKSKFTTGTGIL